MKKVSYNFAGCHFYYFVTLSLRYFKNAME